MLSSAWLQSCVKMGETHSVLVCHILSHHCVLCQQVLQQFDEENVKPRIMRHILFVMYRTLTSSSEDTVKVSMGDMPCPVFMGTYLKFP